MVTERTINLLHNKENQSLLHVEITSATDLIVDPLKSKAGNDPEVMPPYAKREEDKWVRVAEC